jgi:hypothetical protein
VAKLAKVDFPDDATGFVVVERQKGDVSTDFGVPHRPARDEETKLTPREIDRMAALMAAAWKYFDKVAAKAPKELRKGPRGGGRDTDKIVEHVLGAEFEGYAPRLALKLPHAAIDDRKTIGANREAILDALRAGADGKPLREKGWPVRYAARRIAWHALDHAWEIEDRSEG